MTSDLRRQLILGAAKRCFARNGFAGTTTKSVAAAAAISEAISSTRRERVTLGFVIGVGRLVIVPLPYGNFTGKNCVVNNTSSAGFFGSVPIST